MLELPEAEGRLGVTTNPWRKESQLLEFAQVRQQHQGNALGHLEKYFTNLTQIRAGNSLLSLGVFKWMPGEEHKILEDLWPPAPVSRALGQCKGLQVPNFIK